MFHHELYREISKSFMEPTQRQLEWAKELRKKQLFFASGVLLIVAWLGSTLGLALSGLDLVAISVGILGTAAGLGGALLIVDGLQ